MCANIACLLSVMIQPYMPNTSKDIQEIMNVIVNCIAFKHLLLCSCAQIPEKCNVLQDSVVPFIPAGHVISEVYTFSNSKLCLVQYF